MSKELLERLCVAVEKLCDKLGEADKEQAKFVCREQAIKMLGCSVQTIKNYSQNYSGFKVAGARNLYSVDVINKIKKLKGKL